MRIALCEVVPAVLAAAISLGGCNHAAPEPGNATGGLPPVRVTVQPPQKKTLHRVIELPGQVLAYEEAPLLAKVTGYVAAVPVDIGSRVQGPRPANGQAAQTPGQTLLEIDVPELVDESRQREADLRKAQAVVDQAQAAITVAEALRASASADVLEAKSAVLGAEAVVVKWKSESERVSQLASRGAVTQQVSQESSSQLLASEAAVKQAQSKVTSAEARVAEAAAGITKANADLAAALAEVQVAQAALDRVKTQLSFRTLHAPFDGVITFRRVHPGHLVRDNSSEPLLTISRIDKVRVRIDVPENDALLVQVGNRVSLRFPSLPGETIDAKVDRSNESLDRGSRTLVIEADVENQKARLKPGTYAQATIDVATHENVWTIPRSAILTQDKATFVLLVDGDSKVAQLPVQLGLQSGGDVEVLYGLTGSERLILANVNGFRPGQTVEAVEQ